MQLIQDVPGDITLLQRTAFTRDVYEVKCTIPTNLRDIVDMKHYKDAVAALNNITTQYNCKPFSETCPEITNYVKRLFTNYSTSNPYKLKTIIQLLKEHCKDDEALNILTSKLHYLNVNKIYSAKAFEQLINAVLDIMSSKESTNENEWGLFKLFFNFAIGYVSVSSDTIAESLLGKLLDQTLKDNLYFPKYRSLKIIRFLCNNGGCM
ncbi:MAG UNVERIFIED_CONTAM: hypothetical protein LVQ98_07270 [Rickettsiaceae bacterium]|jgi:hypothetical protein